MFNGREPNENRTDLDPGPLGSVSGRLSFAATPRLSVQVSAAHLHEGEAEFAPSPRSDIARATASATYHREAAERHSWATTLAYGVNGGTEVIPGEAIYLTTHAMLVESSLTVRNRHTWFGRFEVVGKPGHDLHVHEDSARIFTVGKLEAG